MHIKQLKFIFPIITIFLIVSCNESKQNNRKVFHVNVSAGLTSLDPAFSKDQSTMWADNQIFNGLVQIDEQLNVKPCIAKSWKISTDGLQYEFNLRNDVYFHDDANFKDGKGRKVVA